MSHVGARQCIRNQIADFSIWKSRKRYLSGAMPEIPLTKTSGSIDLGLDLDSRHRRRSCDWLWPSFCYRLPCRPIPVSSLSVRILCSAQAVILWLSPNPTEIRFCPAPTCNRKDCRQCGFDRSERQRHGVYDHRSINPEPVLNAGCY